MICIIWMMELCDFIPHHPPSTQLGSSSPLDSAMIRRLSRSGVVALDFLLSQIINETRLRRSSLT